MIFIKFGKHVYLYANPQFNVKILFITSLFMIINILSQHNIYNTLLMNIQKIQYCIGNVYFTKQLKGKGT